MTLLRVDASIQGPRSAGSALADRVLDRFTAARPGVPVLRRHLGEDPLPATAWADALAGSLKPQDTLLIKGSRGMRMEEVWKDLERRVK